MRTRLDSLLLSVTSRWCYIIDSTASNSIMSSFKRVISHDELGNLSKKMSTGAENKETEKLLAPNKPTTEEESDDVPVAVIETEIKENVASIPKHLRRVSTLSADDKSVCETEDDSLISQNQLIFMARLGGRASSEHAHHSQPSASGSSGTFGFFVDFEGGEAGEESPKVRKKT
jgi:hypothetical protein